jgi:HEAT repeat protein
MRDSRPLRPLLLLCLLLATGLPPAGTAMAADDAVGREIAAGDAAALGARGRAVLPRIVAAYRAATTPREKASLAYLLYQLGWESPEAERALLADVHTQDPTLRVQVQWALGRVSADPEVVSTLLAILRDDPNPLFRDKAACALAEDQIHLAPAQKVVLFAGLIDALSDDEPQIRQIAIQALHILTGQIKGFRPAAPEEERGAAIDRWRKWLEDYKAAL